MLDRYEADVTARRHTGSKIMKKATFAAPNEQILRAFPNFSLPLHIDIFSLLLGHNYMFTKMYKRRHRWVGPKIFHVIVPNWAARALPSFCRELGECVISEDMFWWRWMQE